MFPRDFQVFLKLTAPETHLMAPQQLSKPIPLRINTLCSVFDVVKRVTEGEVGALG
jgi:hypothetical protein